MVEALAFLGITFAFVGGVAWFVVHTLLDGFRHGPTLPPVDTSIYDEADLAKQIDQFDYMTWKYGTDKAWQLWKEGVRE